MEDIFKDIFKKLEEDGHTIEVEFGWKHNYRKKVIDESIKKLEDSGDELKLSYVKKLYKYYNILYVLDDILKSSEIINEEGDVKYHCEDFYHYLENSIDSSNRIITGIISAVANDKPLENFYKYLMYPDLYPLDSSDSSDILQEEK